MLAFIVYYTTRHGTRRPHSYKNQVAKDIIGLDGTKVMHVLNDLSTIQHASDLLATGQVGEVMLYPSVWINCIDEFGKPIRKLVDYFLPKIKINGDESVCLMALHNTVTLLRQPGPYLPVI